MKKLLRLLLLLSLSMVACTPTTRVYPGSPAPGGPRPERPPVAVSVGTARVDVTPPPTAASFGHAPDAHLMEGVWTRLYCRVFVFDTGGGPQDSIAFVPCELPAPSNLLQRTVAEEVQKLRDDKNHLGGMFPASRIMMTMTHTHAGPAHYLESPAYGGATSSRYPGFDQQMVDFLAGRIARGIADAHARRTLARFRWVHDDVWDLTRSRSIDAYRLNKRHPYAPTAPDPSAPDEYRAIDPALDILEIETADGARPIGWMVFFAMHPTVLPATNRLFGGDAFGVTSRALERELRRTLVLDPARLPPGTPILEGPSKDADPLVALIQTNEGDISPRYTMPTMEETLRVGGALADHAIVAVRKAGKAPFRDRIALDARYLEVDMDTLFKTEGLCEPVLGQAATRGGSDHRATNDGLLQDAPDSDMDSACAPKRKGMGVLQNIIVPPEGFPKHVALAIVRLDTTLISFVPAELTITAGHVIDDAVKQDGPSAERWLVAGLANAYLQYVTTADEYQMQAYEGGSNLYGPRTLGIFQVRLRVLARSLTGVVRDPPPYAAEIDQVKDVSFELATSVARFARPEFTAPLSDLAADRKNRVLCSLPGRKPAALCSIWEDGGPGRVALTQEPWVAIVNERGTPAHICGAPFGKERLGASCDPGATLDDRGTSFRTRTRGESGESGCSDSKTWMWTSIITPTESDWEALAQQGKLRFSARGGKDGADVSSPTFSAAHPPPECDHEQTRYCLAEAPTECLRTPRVTPP
jgi:neutral ceramidase